MKITQVIDCSQLKNENVGSAFKLFQQHTLKPQEEPKEKTEGEVKIQLGTPRAGKG